MNSPIHGKTLDIKIKTFYSKFKEMSTKIPLFSRKMRILDFHIFVIIFCKLCTYLIYTLDKTTFPYINIFSEAKTAIEMTQVSDIMRPCENIPI